MKEFKCVYRTPEGYKCNENEALHRGAPLKHKFVLPNPEDMLVDIAVESAALLRTVREVISLTNLNDGQKVAGLKHVFGMSDDTPL